MMLQVTMTMLEGGRPGGRRQSSLLHSALCDTGEAAKADTNFYNWQAVCRLGQMVQGQ